MIEAEQQKLENEKELKELKRAYGRLFQSDDGKEVLKDLRRYCGQDKSSVCEHSPNALQTLFCEGKRKVFLRIEKMKENKDD